MSDMRYADKVVIITGGSSGIGKACAQEFVRAGAKVVVCCNVESEGTAVASALQALAREQGGGDAYFVFCDVRKTEDIQNLIEPALAGHRQNDCLYNNSRWAPPHHPTGETPVEEVRELPRRHPR